MTRPQQALDIISSYSTAPAPFVSQDASFVNIPQQISDVWTSQNENSQGIKHFDPPNQVPNSFVSAVLPLAVYLPQTVKDKMFNNQFVNFGALLFHDPTSIQQNHIFLGRGISS